VRVAVIVPTLGRPHVVDRVAADVLAASEGHEVTVYFVAELHDADTLRAVEEHPTARLIVNKRAGNYAGAINTAVEETDEPYLFAGADDLHFVPGWLDPISDLIDDYGLVGTNDLANPDVLAGRHATHYMVRRDYAVTACVDAPGQLLFEGYLHNYTDTEVVETAKSRGEFVPCLDAIVEHLHWCWGKANLDPTYEKGRTTAAIDHGVYTTRRLLWTGAR